MVHHCGFQNEWISERAFVASDWVRRMLHHCGFRNKELARAKVCCNGLGERDVAPLWLSEWMNSERVFVASDWVRVMLHHCGLRKKEIGESESLLQWTGWERCCTTVAFGMNEQLHQTGWERCCTTVAFGIKKLVRAKVCCNGLGERCCTTVAFGMNELVSERFLHQTGWERCCTREMLHHCGFRNEWISERANWVRDVAPLWPTEWISERAFVVPVMQRNSLQIQLPAYLPSRRLQHVLTVQQESPEKHQQFSYTTPTEYKEE